MSELDVGGSAGVDKVFGNHCDFSPLEWSYSTVYAVMQGRGCGSLCLRCTRCAS